MTSRAWRLIEAEEGEALFLLLLLLVKILSATGLYALGFTGISADEYSRSISAMKWAQDPFLVMGQTGWLPFQLYLNGTLLKLFPDPLWVPRGTVFIASCLLLLFFYLAVKELFGERLSASVAAIGLLFSHWFSWISATPALDTYYLACIAAALYLGARWLTSGRTRHLYLAAFSLLVSSGFHYQSWMVLACIDALSLWLVFRLCLTRDWRKLGHFAGACVLAHGYVAFTLVATYADVGNALGFVGSHTSYSRWFYGGYNKAWHEKLLYYPKLLIDNANPVFGALTLVGVACALSKARACPRLAVPLLLGVSVLAGYSVFNLYSVPPTAAPARFSLVFYLMLLPYSGFATAQILSPRARRGTWAGAGRTIALGLLAAGALLGVDRARHLPMGSEWNDAVAAGRTMNAVMEAAGPSTGYVVELSYWQHLGVILTAKHYQRQHFDRTKDTYNRSIPSDMASDPGKFTDLLRNRQIRGMAFRDPVLVRLALKYGSLVDRHNDWYVFTVSD